MTALTHSTRARASEDLASQLRHLEQQKAVKHGHDLRDMDAEKHTNQRLHDNACALLRQQLGLDDDYKLRANKGSTSEELSSVGEGRSSVGEVAEELIPGVISTTNCEVVTTGAEPHLIKAASPLWFRTWGLTPEEAVGKDISIINGKGSDTSASSELMRLFQANGHASYRCANVTKQGVILKHTVALERQPDGDILCTSTDFVRPWHPRRGVY